LAESELSRKGNRRVEHYTHLSMRERCLLNTFLEMKLSIRKIAKRMERHPSTLYRELERNTYFGGYIPSIAHEQAKQRHPCPSNKLDDNEELNRYVLDGLQKGWSPEQISGRMKKENKDFYVCAESIYRYVYRNKNLGLYKLLPSKKPGRRARFERKIRGNKSQILARNISHRPLEVNDRNQIGHWEGDTIRFKKTQKSCVTTLVERKSRFVCEKMKTQKVKQS
jgi:IS30 family transposase